MSYLSWHGAPISHLGFKLIILEAQCLQLTKDAFEDTRIAVECHGVSEREGMSMSRVSGAGGGDGDGIVSGATWCGCPRPWMFGPDRGD